MQAEFAGNERVRFVRSGTAGYYKALATAKYLINNATFQQRFAKRPEQVYLNTWHGVPLKHMGVDMPGGGPESRNITRNFLNADYLLSANAYMTDTMYRQAYRMQGIFRGAVIEEGQPRTDRMHEAANDPAAARRLLESRGVAVGDRQVVLFAPTWRGESFMRPWVNAAQLLAHRPRPAGGARPRALRRAAQGRTRSSTKRSATASRAPTSWSRTACRPTSCSA